MKMRLAITVLLSCISTLSFSQSNIIGFPVDYQIGRLPSSRAEAMGQAYVALGGEVSAAYFNPAGLIHIQGIQMNASYATPRFGAIDADYLFLGMAYKVNPKLSFGFSRNNYSSGNRFSLFDASTNQVTSRAIDNEDISTQYTLIGAYEIFRNLSIGLNINYLEWELQDLFSDELWSFDVGLQKKFDLMNSQTQQQNVILGASVVNVLEAQTSYNDSLGILAEGSFPVVARIGASYTFMLDQDIIHPELNTWQFIFQTEYQSNFNQDLNNAIRVGAELTALELISLRLGFYHQSIDDLGSDDNKDIRSDFTYGIGLALPFHKILKKPLPLSINLDYTSLSQVSYSHRFNEFDNFHSVSLRVNWMLARTQE